MKKFFFTYSLTVILTYQVYGQADAKSSGFLKFDLNVDSATVVVNNNYYSIKRIANGDSLRLPTSVNLINISVPFDSKKESYVTIYEDSTIPFRHEFHTEEITPKSMDGNVAAKFHFDANVMIITDDDSEIYYNDELIGVGFTSFIMRFSEGSITVKNSDFGIKRYALKIRDSRVNLREYYRRPKKESARLFAFVPGASQLYKRDYFKAIGFATLSTYLFKTTAEKFIEYNREMEIFHEYVFNYNQQTNEREAIRLGDLAESQQDKLQQIDNERRGFLLSSLIVYAINIFDAYISTPKGGYQNDQKTLKFYLSQEANSRNLSTSATLRYNF